MARRSRTAPRPLPKRPGPHSRGSAPGASAPLRKRAVNWRYNYTVDDAVLQVFLSSSKRKRDELLRIFDYLAANPQLPGDSTQPDRVGRVCHVNRFGTWAVT